MRLLSRKSVAALLEVTPKTVARWVADGKFPAPAVTLPSGDMRWHEFTVMLWIAKNSKENVNPVNSK